MKNGIIIFKEGRIRDVLIDEPLKNNFGRDSMKKLMEDILKRNNFLHNRKIESFIIESQYNKVRGSIYVSKKLIVKGAQAIKRLII